MGEVIIGSVIFGLIILLVAYYYFKSKRQLRSTPATLSEDDAKAMIIEKGFYNIDWNETGAGLPNNYETQANGKVIFDRSTGLMWQQSGSPEPIIHYKKAQEYIAQLNREKFTGFDDWRLPTLEEAMSLMKPIKYTSLYIAPDFDGNQGGIWTADRGKDSASTVWVVDFNIGFYYYGDFGISRYVRAVRSGQSD